MVTLQALDSSQPERRNLSPALDVAQPARTIEVSRQRIVTQRLYILMRQLFLYLSLVIPLNGLSAIDNVEATQRSA